MVNNCSPWKKEKKGERLKIQQESTSTYKIQKKKKKNLLTNVRNMQLFKKKRKTSRI